MKKSNKRTVFIYNSNDSLGSYNDANLNNTQCDPFDFSTNKTIVTYANSSNFLQFSNCSITQITGLIFGSNGYSKIFLF